MSGTTGPFTTAQQEIWRSRIKAEISSLREWEENWGYLRSNDPADPGLSEQSHSDCSSKDSQKIRDRVKVGSVRL